MDLQSLCSGFYVIIQVIAGMGFPAKSRQIE